MFSNIDHIILYLFLFIFFWIWGIRRYNLSTKYFWIAAIVPIFAFSIITGLRTWGPDYSWYKYKIGHPNDWDVKDDEFGFQLLNRFICFIGLDSETGFILYSLIIIIGGFILIRDLKNESKYMYALLIPAMFLETLVHIRQGIAWGIALISLKFLIDKKWIPFVMITLIAVSIHKIIAIFLLIFIAFYLIKTKIVPAKIAIPAYLIATFLPNIIDFNYLSDLFGMLNLSGKYSSYIENSSRWFSEDANNAEWQQGTAALIISVTFDVSVILISNLALKLKYNDKVAIFYNVFVMGAILVRLFFTNELLRRMSTMFYIIYFIPLGYAFYVYMKSKKSFSMVQIRIWNICQFCVYIYLFLYFGRFIFLNKEGLFIWS